MSGRVFSPTKPLEMMQSHLLPVGRYWGAGAGIVERVLEMDNGNISFPVRGLSGLPHVPPFSFGSGEVKGFFCRDSLPL